jgi:hypothetical protein
MSRKTWAILLVSVGTGVLLFLLWPTPYETFAERMLSQDILSIEFQPWRDEPIIAVRGPRMMRQIRNMLRYGTIALPPMTSDSPDFPLRLHIRDGSVIAMEISSPREYFGKIPTGIVIRWKGYLRVVDNRAFVEYFTQHPSTGPASRPGKL